MSERATPRPYWERVLLTLGIVAAPSDVRTREGMLFERIAVERRVAG